AARAEPPPPRTSLGRRRIRLFLAAALHAGIAVDVEIEVFIIDLLIGAILADLLDRNVEGIDEVRFALANGNAGAFAEPFRVGVGGTDELAAGAVRRLQEALVERHRI